MRQSIVLIGMMGAGKTAVGTELARQLGDAVSFYKIGLGMLSGGGHDAAAFAAAGWDSVMVFVRNWNGSHCPEEGMDPADLARAVEAVVLALAEGRT